MFSYAIILILVPALSPYNDRLAFYSEMDAYQFHNM